MKQSTENAILAIVIVLIILIVLYFSWDKGYLDPVLPAAWDKYPKGSTTKSGFRGAFGRTPEMQHCFITDRRNPDCRVPFNACMWV